MSYFQDFASGYGITSGARERKRDRADKLDQEALRKQFELDRDMERYAQENAGRQAGFDNQTNQRVGAEDFTREQSARSEEFTAGEKSKDRSFSADESSKGRVFTGSESAADRTLRKDLQNQQLDQAAKQFAATNDRENIFGAAHLGLTARTQDWRENPANPENKWRDARADQVVENSAPIAAPGAPAAPTAPKLAPNSAPKTITSKADYDALPLGTRFVWNGRNGVKN